MKTLSLKLDDNIFDETEKMTSKLKLADSSIPIDDPDPLEKAPPNCFAHWKFGDWAFANIILVKQIIINKTFFILLNLWAVSYICKCK